MWRHRILFVMAVGLLLAACGTPAAATHAPTPSPTATKTIPSHTQVFSLYSQGPVLPHGPASAWDSTYIDPGAMIFYQGMFHMFFNGITGYPAPVSVGYATSPDGVSWTKVSKNPVLLSGQVGYAGVTIFVSSVVAQPDGAWALYFYTLKNGNAFTDFGAIGRATAPHLTGPWTSDPTPVLQPGKAGSWDALSVTHPSVIRTGASYVMYYSGVASTSDSHGAIGRATSPDGVHWTKYNDPATSDPLHAESDPVLLPGADGAWDSNKVFDPNVVQTENGWAMAYLSRGTQGTAPYNYSAFGYAMSSDGVTWRKFAANPVLSTANVSDWIGI